MPRAPPPLPDGSAGGRKLPGSPAGCWRGSPARPQRPPGGARAALAQRAAELEMPAVALTDHGSLAGAVDLVTASKEQGVKPVLGCEVYVADDRRAQQKGYAHLTLLAQDNEGYSNLIKLSSLGYLEGYYYKPRVDWELLDRHNSGLIALSGCLSGRVCKALEEGRADDAEGELDRLTTIFSNDNVYVEMQNAHLPIQERIL